MSDAQLMHADKMARGEEAYQGKLLEARQSDWKDEAVLHNIKFAQCWCSLGQSISDDPTAMDKVKLFFEHVLAAPVMVHKFMDPCRGEYLWYKGYTNF